MMDASSSNQDVALLLTSGHGVNTDTAPAGGNISHMLSASSMSLHGDAFSDYDLPSSEEENWIRVPANWLDAMPEDFYDRPKRDDDAISSVNSDEAGLYRMFRNFSP